MHIRKSLPARRILAAWLGLLLLMGTMPALVWADEDAARPERTSPLGLYNDLPEQAYYLEPLAYLTDMGAIRPDGSAGFAPDAPVTRATLAVWLARSLGLAPAQGSAFQDVPPDSEEAPYIQALYEAGLVRGYGDGTFRGDSPITRAEAAALLAGVSGRSASPRHASTFADVRETDWFAGVVGALANMKVVHGKAPGLFAPRDYLARAEAAALIHRLLFEVRRIEALDEETVTINGHRYRWDSALTGLFREVNRNALIGAGITFENDGDTIVSVKGLELKNHGAPDRAYLLDGDHAAIGGNLYVSAAAGIILNVHVKGNVVVTPDAEDSVLLYDSDVDGNVLIMPGKADGPAFALMLSGTGLGGGVLVFRDAEVADLDAVRAMMGPEEDDSAAAAPADGGRMALAPAEDPKKTGKMVRVHAVSDSELDDKYRRTREDLDEVAKAVEDVVGGSRDFVEQLKRLRQSAFDFSDSPGGQGAPASEAEEAAAGAGEPADETEQPAAGTGEPAAETEQPAAAADEPAPGPEQPAAPSGRQESGSGHPANADHLNVILIGQTASGKIISDAINHILNTGLSPVFPDGPSYGLDLIVTLPPYTSPFEEFDLNLSGFSEQLVNDPLVRLSTDQILQQIRDNAFQPPGGGAGGVPGGASPQERQNRSARLGLHFVSSANVRVVGESRIEIVDPIHEQVRVTVYGDSDVLEIEAASFGQDGELVLEITGEVGKIVLLGDFGGEIVLTGTGQVGAVETGEGTMAEPDIRLEGDLRVETVNGQPASRLAGPSAPSSSPPPDIIYVPPAPQPAAPSVTQAVYEAYANFVRFELDTVQAARVYYYAVEEGTPGPVNAEQLKQLASEGTDKRGTVNAAAGKAAFTIPKLTEKETYVLYAAAEAPDGTLSELYESRFGTAGIEVVEVSHTVEPMDGGQYRIHFTVNINALGGTVYWALMIGQGDFDPRDIQNQCGVGSGGQCGFAQVDIGSDTVEFAVDVQPPGVPFTYFFYTTVENVMWSDTVISRIVSVNGD